MKRQFVQKTLASLLLATLALGMISGASADKDDATEHTGATELQWMDSGFGPTVSPINGDFSTGSHVTYVKFTAGMMTPLHTHTNDYVGIVLSGVSMHWEPGKPETKKQLSAGAHWFMPADVVHVSECLPGTECLMAIIQKENMDFLPVNP